MTTYTKVLEAVSNAHSICWDGCHKIYIMKDKSGTEKMIEYEYEFIITKDEMKARKMATTIKNWYKNSCSLRFVQVIESDGTENKHYKNIVSQMESWK